MINIWYYNYKIFKQTNFTKKQGGLKSEINSRVKS